MGFFSWCCAVSGKPILGSAGDWPKEFQHLSKVVLLTRKGWIKGDYDGYGRLSVDASGGGARPDHVPENLAEMRDDDVRLVLQSEWKGETFADVKASAYEPNQGFFWDDDHLRDVANDLYPHPHARTTIADAVAAMASCEGSTTETVAVLKDAADDRIGRVERMRRVREEILALDARASARGVKPKDDRACTLMRDALLELRGS